MIPNPAILMKLGKAKREFEERHPKAVAFAEKELNGSLPEGTVVAMTVTRPGCAPVTANLRITAEDVELLKELKELKDK